MRVLVCGGRDFYNQQLMDSILCLIDDREGITAIIEGDARGADRMAGDWAKRYVIPLEIFPANWGQYGNSAGPRRNIQMLQEGKPELVLAFGGHKGTDHMIKIAREAGVRVEIFGRD